ncbi:hypothetical protein A9K58_12110 [Stenotrophomonas maltophilia]|uniref:Uncharacterized protein n=2 Tax=Stenotrophomonas maltophilia TaxID=40324 RepID=A0A1A6XVA0_STEMA|nr:hypothetical protein A9K58_12110 [Stenotrophomonas maltophilia]
MEALKRAKLGDFSQMPGLVELGSGDTHPVNRRLCAELLGDAGPAATVDAIAARLRRLREPCFPFELRRRFECATGIDCSCFYQERVFRPMHASALLEAFLEDSDAGGFESGVRYFFGHRIPD